MRVPGLMGSLGGVGPQESLGMRGYLLKRIFSARGKAVASWQRGGRCRGDSSLSHLRSLPLSLFALTNPGCLLLNRRLQEAAVSGFSFTCKPGNLPQAGAQALHGQPEEDFDALLILRQQARGFAFREG